MKVKIDSQIHEVEFAGMRGGWDVYHLIGKDSTGRTCPVGTVSVPPGSLDRAPFHFHTSGHTFESV